MELKEQKYSGKDLLKTNVFGFYWNNYNFNGYEPIKLKKSMNNVLQNFKRKYKPIISKKLNTIGLKLTNVTYYSPKYYNYEDDELDFHIKIINLKKYLDFLRKNNLISIKDDVFNDISIKDGYNTSIKNNYYNPSIEEMSKVFELLKITASDLELNREFILDNIEYDMRYKENRDSRL